MPPPRRRRPTAFQVSCPEEATQDTQDESASGLDRQNNRRRPRDNADDDQERSKRQRTDERPREPKHYQPKPDEILETEDLILIGEDFDAINDGQKPTRMLSHFAFFDPTRHLVMISLSYLDEKHDNDNLVLEGAGQVFSMSENDEDERQEDERQFIRITHVLGYYIDYTENDEPLCIVTDHARYLLGDPSKKYRREFRTFFKSHRIVQMIVSSAIREPERQYRDFLKELLTIDIVGTPPSEQDVWHSVPELRYALEGLENAQEISTSKVIQFLFSKNAPPILRPVSARRAQIPVPPVVISGNGSKDFAVLRSENQNKTHVTPRIAKLAMGWFEVKLVVVGPPPLRDPSIPYDDSRLKTFVRRVSTRRDIRYRPEQRLRPRSRWLKYITIDGKNYAIGDTVVVAIGRDEGKLPPELPDPANIPKTDTLADHFWFGRIVYINEEYDNVHVEWFEHSTKTAMEQLGHPQELFLTNICSTLEIDLIVEKVSVHFVDPSKEMPAIKPPDFFYKFIYDRVDGTFTEIPRERLLHRGALPPDHCHVCLMVEEKEEELVPQKIRHGVAWKGAKYHACDTVMIKAEEGQCHIGQIVRIQFAPSDSEDSVLVRVRLFGRIDKLGLQPAQELKDERHLFVTPDETTKPISAIIGPCRVYVRASVPDLESWLNMSPYHFYACYAFPSINVTSWEHRQKLTPQDILVCKDCTADSLAEWEQSREFLKKQKPLRALDPFAGSGALGLGLEEIGCVKLTHAVEISPSAAKTLKINSPDTVVYNQCSNLVMKEAIQTYAGHNITRLKRIDVLDDEDELFEDPYIPDPPKPEDIDCIVAGFPCQPHSSLNMYTKANDPKSYLILNLLSWIDFMQPKYCFFENVRGFLTFRLKARQAGLHRVEGGIQMGGLKFLLRAMTDMKYQLRFGILQAAHYGTPQHRLRFFMVAAKNGFPLPEFPQPTHEYKMDALEIKLPIGHNIKPKWAQPGYAPHRLVTIDDAISDLPRFDWANPKPPTNPVKRQEERERARTIPLKKCKNDSPWCGYSKEDAQYMHDPKTAIQKWFRRKPSKNLQQYTRTYEDIKVERIVNIAMKANADYKSLRADLWEYHFANPSSAVARGGYKPGLYGRADKDQCFQTIITNIDPTAKQGRVINPYCKRIFTVRELARSQGFPDSFVFYAENDHVVTMHRQIGNAVPWQVTIAIGRELRKVMMKKWLKDRDEAIEIE